MREITNSINFTKRDAMNSRSGVSLQGLEVSSKLTLIAAAVIKDVKEETGEIQSIGVLVTNDKKYYTTISATVISCIGDLIDIIADEGAVEVRLDKRQSKAGRSYLVLTLL